MNSQTIQSYNDIVNLIDSVIIKSNGAELYGLVVKGALIATPDNTRRDSGRSWLLIERPGWRYNSLYDLTRYPHKEWIRLGDLSKPLDAYPYKDAGRLKFAHKNCPLRNKCLGKSKIEIETILKGLR